MSNRISQGSTFQPATPKGPQGPTAPTVAAKQPTPEPVPTPTPPPPPAADEFIRNAVRDFKQLLGQVESALTGTADPASASSTPDDNSTVRGDENGRDGDIIIEGSSEPPTNTTA